MHTCRRLLKMFKAVSMRQLTTPLETFFGTAQVSFALLIFFFFLIFHGTACGFHLIAMLGNESSSWIQREGLVDSRILSRYGNVSTGVFSCMHACMHFHSELHISRREYRLGHCCSKYQAWNGTKVSAFVGLFSAKNNVLKGFILSVPATR